MALRRVFTYLGAVFLMSHIIFSNNVGAINNTTLDLSNYDLISYRTRSNLSCNYNGTNYTNRGVCVNINNPNGFSYLGSILTAQGFNAKKGDIFEFDINVYSLTNFPYSSGFIYVNSGNSRSNTKILGVSETSSTVLPSDLIQDGDTVSNGNYFNKVYHFIVQVGSQDDANYLVGLETSDVNNHPIFAWYQGSVSDQLSFRLMNIYQWRLNGSGSPDQQNEINATNDSVQESQSEGNSSQSDAQTSTTSLVSTIGSAVSAITSATPTNCLLNGNMGNFDMGQIDLCANPVPPFVQIISSLILILITVPLCIVMFNRFIGLFRSFQG